MAHTLIATMGDDKLFIVGSHPNEWGDLIWHGVIERADGRKIDVPNVDELMSRGYWDSVE